MAGLRVNLIRGSPEAHGTIANGQLGRIHPSAFKAEENLPPALRTFAHAVLNCHKSLLATGSYPINNKGTELVILASKAFAIAVR